MNKIWRSSNWLPCRIFFKTAELIKELSVTSVRPRSSSSLSQTAPSNATVSSGILVAENISVLRQKELGYRCVREQHRLSNLELQKSTMHRRSLWSTTLHHLLVKHLGQNLCCLSVLATSLTQTFRNHVRLFFWRQVDKVSRHQHVINGLYK